MKRIILALSFLVLVTTADAGTRQYLKTNKADIPAPSRQTFTPSSDLMLDLDQDRVPEFVTLNSQLINNKQSADITIASADKQYAVISLGNNFDPEQDSVQEMRLFQAGSHDFIVAVKTNPQMNEKAGKIHFYLLSKAAKPAKLMTITADSMEHLQSGIRVTSVDFDNGPLYKDFQITVAETVSVESNRGGRTSYSEIRTTFDLVFDSDNRRLLKQNEYTETSNAIVKVME